jgi:hypothetical protein
MKFYPNTEKLKVLETPEKVEGAQSSKLAR